MLKGCTRAQSLSHVQLFVTPLTVAHQALLSMEFFRKEYWSRLPFLPLGNVPNPGTKPHFYGRTEGNSMENDDIVKVIEGDGDVGEFHNALVVDAEPHELVVKIVD